jgi:threonine dehydrogenase-like Zn-dependent dehydrogenase
MRSRSCFDVYQGTRQHLLALGRYRAEQRNLGMRAAKMKAAVLVEPGRIVLEDKPVPEAGPLDALIRITTTTICGRLGDHKIITTLCPGGKERMRRLMAVIASGRVHTRPLLTHRFKLDDIEAAYDLFSHQRDGVLKVAITP